VYESAAVIRKTKFDLYKKGNKKNQY